MSHQPPSSLVPLNQPRPVAVQADAIGRPQRIAFPVGGPQRQGRPHRWGAPHAVDWIDEAWRIVDEWWRTTPIARTYYRVVLADGRRLTLFHDDVSGSAPTTWFLQEC